MYRTERDDYYGGSSSTYGLESDPADDFRDRGLCAETDPEAFFPEKGGSTRAAKAICRGCEVRAECLQYALDNDERFGIWGGLSERERRALKQKTPTPPGASRPRVHCRNCQTRIIITTNMGPTPEYCSRACREIFYQRRSA